MQDSRVDTFVVDGIAQIEFFSPSGNSLPSALLDQLTIAVQKAGENDEIKCIVIKSSGERAFCAGASFDELVAINSLEDGTRFFSGFANVINAIRKAPKFVLGRVQGKTVGGGVGLASAVDYCLATEAASVKLSELAVGIGPFVVGPAVERKIGKAAMSALAIDATNWKSAKWAYEKGLYAEVYSDIATMDAALSALSHRLATSNPEAMRALKQALWEDCTHWDVLLAQRAATSGKLVVSEFTKKFIADFKAGMRG